MGPQGTEFEGGYYHGRIILPTEYPMKPPSIIMLTVSHFSLSLSELSFLSISQKSCSEIFLPPFPPPAINAKNNPSPLALPASNYQSCEFSQY